MFGRAGTPEVEGAWDVARGMKLDVRYLSATEARTQFPFLHFEDNFNLVYEVSNAGHVNPRKLVMAEQKIAASQVRQ